MSTKLLRQIKNSIPDLRKSEKVVGEFILENTKSVITMKTAEASEAMGTVSYTHLTLPTKPKV